MKKILLIIFFTTASLVTFAQLPTFGIKGGANFSTLNLSANGSNVTANSGTLTSFNAGVFVDLKFGNVSLQPALNLTGKGGKFNSTDDVESESSAKFNILYLQLPVNIVYHVPAVVGNFYFGAGPYLAKGLSGTIKGTQNGGGSSLSISEDVKFGDDGDLNSADYGVDALVGFQFKSGFLINANYDLGLANILPGDGSNGKMKTRALGVSIGFAF